MPPSLSVIVPTSGERLSLAWTLESISTQLKPGDELLVDYNKSSYGNEGRRRQMEAAHGDAILFQDDDDIYVPGALDAVRREFARDPFRPHIFKMRYVENDFVLWQDLQVRCGNVASQMLCVPNIKSKLGVWTDRYESDFDFIASTVAKMGEPVWHEEVISLVRHPLLRDAQIVVVNAHGYPVLTPTIHYDDVLDLARATGTHPTVVYHYPDDKDLEHEHPWDGELKPGETLEVVHEMRFFVTYGNPKIGN